MEAGQLVCLVTHLSDSSVNPRMQLDVEGSDEGE